MMAVGIARVSVCASRCIKIGTSLARASSTTLTVQVLVLVVLVERVDVKKSISTRLFFINFFISNKHINNINFLLFLPAKILVITMYLYKK
jgi:hypothetical protein